MLIDNSTSLPGNGTSAQPDITTAAPTDAPSADSKIMLEFKLLQNFSAQLANKSSQEFEDLASKVQAAVSTLTVFQEHVENTRTQEHLIKN